MLRENEKEKERVRRQQQGDKPRITKAKWLRFKAVKLELERRDELRHIDYLAHLPKVRRWTVAAANCYLRRLQCEGCVHKPYCENARPAFIMRQIVRKLIRELGTEGITETMQEESKIYIDIINLRDTI